MKTNKYIYRTVAAAAVALPLSLFTLASCSDEDQSIPTDIKGQVQFTASVSEAPASRADVAYTPVAGQLTVYGNSWVSAVKSNYGYNTNTEGWTCTSKEPLYWKDITGTSEYVFYAVAPSEPAPEPAVMKDQSSLENFTASDLLVARSTVAAKETEVPFVLKHVLSQMEINLTTTEGDEKLTAEELATAIVTIDGLKTAYTLAVGTTAEAPVIATVAGDAVNGMKPCKDAGVNTFRYITVPQTVTADPGMTLNFTVTVGGKELKYVYNHKPIFAAGKKNVYHITITKSNLKVGSVTVTDWADGSSETVLQVEGLTNPEGTLSVSGAAITPATGDALALTYVAANALSTDAKQRATYTYGGTAWSSDAALIWENIAKAAGSATFQFAALYTPAAGTATQRDYLVGLATASTFGSELSLQLNHALAKMNITLTEEAGADLLSGISTCAVKLIEHNAVAVKTDGTADITMASAASDVLFTSGASFFVAPQTLTADHVITLTRANGNKYTIKLSELMNGTEKLFTNGIVEAGKHYTITLTVNESTVGITAGIADWTDVEGSGTAKPEF